MGLDMGIRVKRRYDLLPKWFKIAVKFPNNWEMKPESYLNESRDIGIDVCYWRNERDFNREIMSSIVGKKSSIEESDFELNQNQIKALIKKIKFYYRHPKDWDEIGHWEYEDCCENMKRNIWNLRWTLLLMRFHSDIKVIYYASY